jgi:hypothetical protein
MPIARPSPSVDKCRGSQLADCTKQGQQKPLSLRQAEPMPWTPYADWIFTVVSTGSILLIVWLVLRPRP